MPTDRTFTGQEQDGTGLMYYHARYYDGSLGTFVSPDTVVPGPGVVADYNRFAYVRNNPLRFSNPTGHKVCERICPDDFVTQDIHLGEAFSGEWDTNKQKANSTKAAQVFSTLLGIIPGVGDGYDAVATATGSDPVTGDDLSLTERTITAAAMLVPGVAGGPLVKAKRVVIGEGMDQVRTAARLHDAKWYQAWSKYFDPANFDLDESLRRNERWILNKIEEGYEILDIGIDPTRARRSPFYELERRILDDLVYPTIPILRPPK